MREARGLAARFSGRRRRRRHFVAQAAFERRPEPSSPAVRVDDPRPQLERRLVAHVLLMAAGELRDPVAVRVSVVADDRALHGARVRRAARR